MKRLVRVLSIIVALFGEQALKAEAPADPPLRIGVSLGLTGNYAAITGMQEKAYRLWERHVNERGGILGRPVQMIIRDDGSDAASAQRIYEDFVLRDKTDFVFGPYSSTITSAVAPVVEGYRYPMLASGASSDELWQRGYRYLFGTISPAGRFTTGFLAVLAEAKVTQLAIAYADDTFSANVAVGTKRWAEDYGLKVVAFDKVPKGAVALDKIALGARDAGAQAMLMAGYFDEAVNMRKALKRIDWTPAAYYASVGPGLDSYQAVLGGDAEGTFSTSIWEAREDLKIPGAVEFMHEFVRSYGEKPSYHAAQAYAAGQILEQAIKKAGSTERAAVREALFLLDTQVVIGRYVVDRTGVQTKQLPLITQWQRGRREIVFPSGLRTAPPIVRKRL